MVNAISLKTGMVTYYGPNFEVIAASRDASLTLDCFKRCLMQDEPFKLIPSETFYNTRWAEQEIKIADSGLLMLVPRKEWSSEVIF